MHGQKLDRARVAVAGQGRPPAEHVLSPLLGCPIRRPAAPDRLGCHADSPGQRGWKAAGPARGIRTCPSSPSRAARVAISRCRSSEWDNQLSSRQLGLRVHTSSWNPKNPEVPEPSESAVQSRSFKTILTCAAWPPDSCPNSMSGFRKPSDASGNWKPSESDVQSRSVSESRNFKCGELGLPHSDGFIKLERSQRAVRFIRRVL
jgi:hypothetical protein